MRSSNGKLMRRAGVVLAASITTSLLAVGVASADTQPVSCTNHNTQAVLSTPDGYLCFDGTGRSWTGRIARVLAVSSGNYTVVLSYDNGGGDPFTLGPHQQSNQVANAPIVDVQLF